MNYLDIAITAIVGFFLVRGVKSGLVNTLTGVISFILALIIATGMMSTAAGYLQAYIRMDKEISYIVGYVILFVGTLLVFKLAANVILKVFTITSMRWVDRIGGGLFGLFIGGMIVSSVLVALSFFSFTEKLLPERNQSFLYPYTKEFFPVVYNIVVKLKPASQSFQEITEEILDGKGVEALKKSQAGRELIEYWDKLNKERQKVTGSEQNENFSNLNTKYPQRFYFPSSRSSKVVIFHSNHHIV